MLEKDLLKIEKVKENQTIKNMLSQELKYKEKNCNLLSEVRLGLFILPYFNNEFDGRGIDALEYILLHDVFEISSNRRKDFIYLANRINNLLDKKLNCENCNMNSECCRNFGSIEPLKHFIITLALASTNGDVAQFSDEQIKELLDIIKENTSKKTLLSYLKSDFLDSYFGYNHWNIDIAKVFFNYGYISKEDFEEISSYKQNNESSSRNNGLKDDLGDINTHSQSKALRKLHDMVGLDAIKKQMEEFSDLLSFIKMTEDELDLPERNLNCSFEGNPGTGKTVTAKIYADLLFETGFIKSNKLVCVSADELIAEHIRGTAIKTVNVVKKALGGVLFIDEAYQLTPSSEKDFSKECIATLVREMTEHKNNLVVIFAGYKDEMEEFINVNPGMKSRITNRIHFKDYSIDELYQIFKKNSDKSKLHIADGVESLVKKIFADKSKNKDFGNARFVENLFNEIVIKHSSNIMKQIRSNKLTPKDNAVKTITIEDIESLDEEYIAR